MNSNFYKELGNTLKNIINEKISIKLNIDLGYIKNNLNTFDHSIYQNNFNYIHNKFKNYKDKKKLNTKHYFYQDMELISIDEYNQICLKKNTQNYFDFKNTKLNKYNTNYGFIRIKLKDDKKINIINFPSLIQYNEITEKNTNIYTIKFKNSEINIYFSEINNSKYEIYLSLNCDAGNLDNSIKNLMYIFNKIYGNSNFSKINL